MFPNRCGRTAKHLSTLLGVVTDQIRLVSWNGHHMKEWSDGERFRPEEENAEFVHPKLTACVLAFVGQIMLAVLDFKMPGFC